MLRIPGFGPRNRRRRREGDFTFDVRLSADTPGAPSRRRSWWARPVLFVLLAAGIYFGGGQALRLAREQWLYRIDRLALKHIIIQRDGLLSVEEVRKLAGVEPGRNVLTVDVYQIRERLKRHPRIEDARVDLDFPDTLRVAVRERVPVARIVLPPLGSAQAYLLVDDLGYLFLPFGRGDASADVLEAESALPNLLGVNSRDLGAGRHTSDPQLLGALQLLLAFDRSPLVSQSDIVNVDLSAPPVMTVLTRSGSRITVATERDFDRQLVEWNSVHHFGLKSGFAIGQLDLSVTNNPPLRWADPGTNLPETTPVPVRPKRKPVRRHV